MMNKSNRLETIANRQRKSFVRDALFAVGLTIATIAGCASVATAAHAGVTSHVVK